MSILYMLFSDLNHTLCFIYLLSNIWYKNDFIVIISLNYFYIFNFNHLIVFEVFIVMAKFRLRVRGSKAFKPSNGRFFSF